MAFVCDCCRREVAKISTNRWMQPSLLCFECISEWYDPVDPNVTRRNHTSPLRIGNYVRSIHGLPPTNPANAPHEE